MSRKLRRIRAINTVEIVGSDRAALAQRWVEGSMDVLADLLGDQAPDEMINRGSVVTAQSLRRRSASDFSRDQLSQAGNDLLSGSVRAAAFRVFIGERWRFQSVFSTGDASVGHIAVVNSTAFDYQDEREHLFQWAYRVMTTFADIPSVVHGRVTDGWEFSDWERRRWHAKPPVARGYYYQQAGKLVAAPDWGLLLGPAHVKRLGRGVLHSEELVVEQFGSEDARIGVRATQAFEEFNAEREKSWARTLSPILWDPPERIGRKAWKRRNGPAHSSFLLLADPED